MVSLSGDVALAGDAVLTGDVVALNGAVVPFTSVNVT